MNLGENIIIKNILFLGAGYVGATNSIVMAYKCPDISVTAVDNNSDIINAWNNGQVPIFEPHLEDIYNKVKNANFKFSSDVVECIKNADAIFICVNTPTKLYGCGKGRALDMSYLEQAAVTIRKNCVQDNVIIVEKSTVPVKSAERIYQILSAKPISTRFHVISNPEFLSEGNAVKNYLEPDRVIIGGNKFDKDFNAIQALKNIYLRWVDESKIILTDAWSAELSKLTSNAFLAQKISSINTLTSICEKTGANVLEVANAVGMDSRIGSHFLSPSLGFGGSCFKKDILCLVYLCEVNNLKEISIYWHSILQINEYQKKNFFKKIVISMFDNINGKNICIYGATFKADTSDIRDSASLYMIRKVYKEGGIIKLYDPCANKDDLIRFAHMNSIDMNKFMILNCPYMAADCANAIVVCTEWDIFKKLDYDAIYKKMQKPAFIFDGRIILDNQKLKDIGFNIYTLGCS